MSLAIEQYGDGERKCVLPKAIDNTVAMVFNANWRLKLGFYFRLSCSEENIWNLKRFYVFFFFYKINILKGCYLNFKKKHIFEYPFYFFNIFLVESKRI